MVKKTNGKPNVYGQCKSWLDNGLQARAMTRDSNWGVPVPVDGAEGKVIYVWFDAPIWLYQRHQRITAPKAGMITGTRKIPSWCISLEKIISYSIVSFSRLMLKAHGDFVLPGECTSQRVPEYRGR